MFKLSRIVFAAAGALCIAIPASAATIVAPETMKWADAQAYCTANGASMLDAESLKARFKGGDYPSSDKRDAFWSSSEYPSPYGKPDAHETVNGSGFITSVKDVYTAYVICFK